jgi:hypothetical protein
MVLFRNTVGHRPTYVSSPLGLQSSSASLQSTQIPHGGLLLPLPRYHSQVRASSVPSHPFVFVTRPPCASHFSLPALGCLSPD